MSFDWSVVKYGAPIFFHGMLNTIYFCSFAIIAGLLAGSCIALGRLSKRSIARFPATFIVELLRNTPFLVQVYLLYYALPAIGLSLGATTAGLVALTAYAAAYFSEAIRGAILSVPRAQMESGRALGLSYLRSMQWIIAPQMMGYLLPALTNQIIGVIKNSAVLSVITVPEMAMAAQQVLGETFSPVKSYTMVALIYWALTTVVATVMARLERRSTPATRFRTQVPRGLALMTTER